MSSRLFEGFCLFVCFSSSLSLTFSLCRLERLQRVVGKVQMESGVCEEQLNQVETLLQAVRPKAFSSECFF